MKKKINLISILISSFIVGLIFIFSFSVHSTIYWNSRVGRVFNEELGFKHGSPYINGKETTIIEEVIPDGIFEKAGVRCGDQPYKMEFTDFFKLLWKSQGEEIDVEFVNAFDTSVNPEIRIIRIKVPKIKLKKNRDH